jgi:hypothetical protein
MRRRFACLLPETVRRIGRRCFRRRRASGVDHGVDFFKGKKFKRIVSGDVQGLEEKIVAKIRRSRTLFALESLRRSCGRRRKLWFKQEHDDLGLSGTNSSVKEVRAHGIESRRTQAG